MRKTGIRRVEGDIRADETIFDRRRSVPQSGITGGPFLGALSGLAFERGLESGSPAGNPAKRAGEALARELRDAGVRVTGRVVVGPAPKRAVAGDPLAQAPSPTAAQLLAMTNKPSDNFFAETLLKRLAARGGGQGTTAKGVRKVERFARRSGSGLETENGSGLSRRDRSSPREVGHLLVRMARSGPPGTAFRASLPIAGRDGTLAGRMRGTAAEGRCMAKTGTIDAVSALSGYCRSGHGLVVFSLLMNSVDVSAAQRAQDKIVAAIARYR